MLTSIQLRVSSFFQSSTTIFVYGLVPLSSLLPSAWCDVHPLLVDIGPFVKENLDMINDLP